MKSISNPLKSHNFPTHHATFTRHQVGSLMIDCPEVGAKIP